MTNFAILTAVCVVLLLGRERRGDLFGQTILKLVASTGFVGCALVAGAAGSGFGRWILAGLVASWFGDLCLLSRDKRPFMAGLVAFLLAHLAYSVAFLEIGVDRSTVLLGALSVAAIAAGVGSWLVPKVAAGMRAPVLAYLVVISSMVALGGGAAVAAPQRGVPEAIAAVLLIAPVLFYLSDLAVARDRFATRSFANRLVGLPLYYLAQTLFAISTRLV